MGGGVLALIHKRIPHRLVYERDFCSEIQLLVLEIKANSGNILLLLCYRSPSCASNTFTEFTDFLGHAFEEWSSHILLMGDFDFPTIDWTSMGHKGNISTRSSSLVLDLVMLWDLTQLVNRPTHGLNILDLLLVSQPSIVETVRVLPPFSTSDHNSILFTISDAKESNAQKFVETRNFFKGDYISIISTLAQIDWLAICNSSTNVDILYSKYVDIFHDLIKKIRATGQIQYCS